MNPARTAAIRGALAALALTLVSGAGFALAVSAGATVDPLRSDALGLISAIPPTYFAGLSALLVAFVLTVRRTQLNRPLLVAQLFLLIIALYGLVSWREDIARLPTGWVHAGFIDYIQRTNTVLTNYDARFVWPGFFAFGALLNEMAGVTVSNLFLSWSPVILNLLYAVPVWTIARGAGAPVRAAYLATALFALVNWVGQDYYSPQGINELFALAFLAVVIRVFFNQSGVVPLWLRRIVEPQLEGRAPTLLAKLRDSNLQPGTPSRIAITGRQKAALVGALVILYTACVASHQLTPFFLVVATAALVILDRSQLRVFPVVMVVGVLIWISYAAAPFWAGNLKNLFGDVGNIGSTLNQNVDSRVTGDPAHKPVLYARLLLAGGLWGAAVLGVVRRLRHRRIDIVCLVGFLAPFAILAGQSYGGEAVFRVYLFGLAFSATLVALLFAPTGTAWNKKTTVAVIAILLALQPMFFLTRYGNEAFEGFTLDEYRLAQQVLQAAPDGARLVALNSNLPWRTERIEQLGFTAADSLKGDDEVQTITNYLLPTTGQPTYFIVTRAQDEYAHIVQGKPDGYGQQLVDTLLQSGRFRLAFANTQGRVIVPVNQP